MEVRLQKATREDAEEILAMQKDAFSDLLNKYKDYDTSPATRVWIKLWNGYPNRIPIFILYTQKGLKSAR